MITFAAAMSVEPTNNIEIQDTAELPRIRRWHHVPRWYVFVARHRKEVEVRDELRSRGFKAYVPMQYALTRAKVKRRVLRPAIHELVFVYASMQQILDYKHSTRLGPYLFFRSRRIGFFWEPLVVSDEAMDNFIKLTSLTEIPMNYYRPEELRLEKGDEVRILDGPFTGIVGRVQRLPHRKGEFLVLELPGITTVAARLKPQFVEPLQLRIAPSQHVEADVKRLDEVASTLLFDQPCDTATEQTRATLLAELRTLRLSLKESKVVMTADRVAYALAHLLASLATGEDTAARETYRKTLSTFSPKLKSTSHLRLRAAIYLSRLYDDAAANRFLAATLHAWDIASTTASQRAAIAEWKKTAALKQ